jgi:GNAT superfamily N-acetyltransferase
MIISTLKPSDYSQLKPQIFAVFLNQSTYQSHIEEEQQSYFIKWVESYYLMWPEWFFVVLENNEVLGYLCACPDSFGALDKIAFKSYHLFKSYYQKYPLHFHINVKPGQTGRGIGALMLRHLQQVGSDNNISNCHIITSEHEKNVDFYSKNGFKIVAKERLNNHTLLLMSLDLRPTLSSASDKNLLS